MVFRFVLQSEEDCVTRPKSVCVGYLVAGELDSGRSHPASMPGKVSAYCSFQRYLISVSLSTQEHSQVGMTKVPG